MNVLSLFDGMSCGQIALDRLGIKVDNYFASEIDVHAMVVSKANYPNTIYLGDVRYIDLSKLPKIDLLLGGSPCQSFSFAGKRRGMSTKCEEKIETLERYLELKELGFEFLGQSYLFWEYVRVLKIVKPKNFLLENVMMVDKWRVIITRAVGANPIDINSSLVSAQNRRRLYWTNIGLEPQGLFGELYQTIKSPEDMGIMLRDILEENVDPKYTLSDKMVNYFKGNHKKMKEGNIGFTFTPTEGDKKSFCITTKEGSRMENNYIICHNTQQRNANRPSIKKDKNAGGSGHLSKSDGKSYTLDTQQSNAIEIVKGGDFRFDEGFRWRENGKSGTLNARGRSEGNDFSGQPLLKENSKIRRLTPVECERLQTVPDHYTDYASDTQRYKMLGNGWTINVISYIISHLKQNI